MHGRLCSRITRPVIIPGDSTTGRECVGLQRATEGYDADHLTYSGPDHMLQRNELPIVWHNDLSEIRDRSALDAQCDFHVIA